MPRIRPGRTAAAHLPEVRAQGDMPMPPSPHHWRFFRIGGFDQVRLETAQDLLHLDELDQKLWAALSCPVHGLEFDPRTLTMLDTDDDGRVRAPEVLEAVRWTASTLKNMDGLIAGHSYLSLADIDDSHPEGRALLASARHILKYLDKPDATRITIEDLDSTQELLQNSLLNGDGVVIPASADNPELKILIEEVMSAMGTVMDRSGQEGISSEQAAAFFDEAAQYVAWRHEARLRAESVLPFGDNTPAAAEAFFALRPKIDDFFTRCGLAAFDSRAEEPLNPSLGTYETLAAQELETTGDLARFPLAKVKADRTLPLKTGLNPAWEAPMSVLRETALIPMFGDEEYLSIEKWQQVKAAFADHEAWLAEKAGARVEGIGLERLQSILSSPARMELEALIARDLELSEQVDSFDKVARLTYFTRDLMVLLNNFVTFYDFYSQKRKAIFQAGTLYLDGRACELCVRVDDMDAHQVLATLSRTYLVYCQCRRRNSEERMTIAAAFTNGDSDNLMVGRNGIFYDRNGDDWDATIVKVIEHPISVRQAFWSPYKRVGRMIGEQIEKFAAAKDKAVEESAGAKVATLGAPAAEPGKAPTPFDVGKFAGIFAAIGLALGAIGTALAAVLSGFLSLSLWQMPLAVGGILLVISGPSMLIAYMKLRQRNLGPILDAGGWAVNSKAKINIPFGATLTKVAALPPGAERSLRDPFAEKRTPWKRWVALIILIVILSLAWDKGYIQQLSEKLKSSVQTQEPAPQPEEKPAQPAVEKAVPEPATPAAPEEKSAAQ